MRIYRKFEPDVNLIDPLTQDKNVLHHIFHENKEIGLILVKRNKIKTNFSAIFKHFDPIRCPGSLRRRTWS